MMQSQALNWQDHWCWRLRSEQDTLAWGANLARLGAHGIFYLQGDLGAGKTCLVRGVLRALGYQDAVPSPSYALVEQYEISGKTLTHFDLYRLQTSHELEHIGFRDYIEPSRRALCFVEWPENALDYLRAPDVWLRFAFVGTQRALSAASGSDAGVTMLDAMSEQFAS